jgi:hypothetical protein
MKKGNFCIHVTPTPLGTAFIVIIIAPDGSLTTSGCLSSLHDCWIFAEDTIERYHRDV